MAVLRTRHKQMKHRASTKETERFIFGNFKVQLNYKIKGTPLKNQYY